MWLAALGLLAAAPAAKIYTPQPGNPERKAILDAVRGGPGIRFTITRLVVFHHRDPRMGSIAWLDADNGLTGGVTMIITRKGKAGWRDVWSESSGANDCERALPHFEWGAKLIRSYGLTPDQLAPGFTKRIADMKAMLASGEETMCAGDLAGGTVDGGGSL